MKITGASIYAEGGWPIALVGTDGTSPTPPSELASTIEVRGSSLTAKPLEGGGGDVVMAEDGIMMRIVGSKLSWEPPSVGDWTGLGLSAVSSLVVVANSEVFGNKDTCPITGSFAGSMIDTPIDPTAKVVNCWDANFQPIPNQ